MSRNRLPQAICLLSLFLALGCGTEKDEKSSSKEKKSHKESTRARESNEVPSGEGMWPWSQISEMDGEALKKRGLRVPLSKLWTPGKGGLIEAAVGLGGCTGSFVSKDGLLLTNHHCVLSALQRNSTDENNLLTEGFIAENPSKELDGKGLRVYIFKNKTDVTKKIQSEIAKLENPTDLERMNAIEAEEKRLVKACEEKPSARCYVSRNNNGLSFDLFERIELRDVRLVGAPPSTVGNYGGEIDNWHWPRHSMDFALIRAYVGKDGNPSDFSEDNVPYKPNRFFKVSTEGVSEGDLVMVIGTPGRTSRYRTEAAVKHALDWYYPLRVSLLSEWIETLEETCREIPESCLPTSATQRGLNNGLTNSKGMIAGLKRLKIIEKKRREQKEWRRWIEADEKRKSKFGNSLDELEKYIENSQEGRTRDLLLNYMTSSRRAHLIGFARIITKWAKEQEKPDEEREKGFQQRDEEKLLSQLTKSARSVHVDADRRVLSMFLSRLGKLPENERVKALDQALGGNFSDSSIDKFLSRLYKGTSLSITEKRVEMFKTPLNELRGSNDSMIKLALALAPELDALEEKTKTFEGAMTRLRPKYVSSLIEMKKSNFYPDANGSPRISFATVTGYKPRDGVIHTPFTSADGILAKHTGKEPFDAPQSILNAIEERRFGRYAEQGLGSVPICFLSNADTTGGNSGSPAINGEGQLVGLNFDRVYENIPGDFGYNPPLSRNIMVDVRSVLWYLEAIVGASHLMREMGASKTEMR